MSFCSLTKGITPKICRLCACALINSVLLNLLCVWILFQKAITYLVSIFFFFFFFFTPWTREEERRRRRRRKKSSEKSVNQLRATRLNWTSQGQTWQPLVQPPIAREKAVNTLCYKCVTGPAPSYLCDCLQLYTPSRTLRSASDTLSLQIPRTRLSTVGSRAFSVFGPSTWNDLPLPLRQKPSLGSFKHNLKTFIFPQ